MKRVLSLALVTFALSGMTTLASATQSDRTVVVYGKALRSVVPDVVVWTVSITTEDPLLSAAKKVNDERLEAVLKVANQIVDDRQEVKVGPVRIDRMYTRGDERGLREFSHFMVSRSVNLTQREFDTVEKTLNALINSAEVELRFRYEISKEDQIIDELRLQALDSAKVKAGAMVGQFGGTLGPVVEISEFPPSDTSMRGVLGIPAPAGTMIDQASPEAREIAVTVYVTFAIE